MTGPVFVDTAALIALISRDDAWHALAQKQFTSLNGQNRPFLTSSAVLYELLDGAAARGPLRSAALSLIHSIRNSRQWPVIHVTTGHMRKGEMLYASRMDKVWSLTDCTNMEIAHEHGVEDVMTSDGDYQQAGFRALLCA